MFPTRIQEELTAAYLVEQIPASVGKRVRVSIVREGGEEPIAIELDRPLPGSHNDRVIATLAKAITTDPNLAIVLDYLASAVEGRQPLGSQTGEDLTVMTVEERGLLDSAERELAAQEGVKARAKRGLRYGEKPKPRKA